jgi:hypothetical protein
VPDELPLSSLTKPEFLALWFQSVWTQEDASAIERMMAPGSVIKGVGNFDSVGPADFKVFQQSLLTQIGGMNFTILRTIEEGDWIAGLWSLTATHRQTGNPVSTTGTVFVEIRDGQFVGGYNHFDTLGMYQDLGLLPPDTVPRLLAGSAFS